ncbi:MAG TPA: hypothetical protein VH012_06240 [Acidimicrobiales bacterium]|nr:hypothetical protein [Acidimicrobiales bacterium]
MGQGDVPTSRGGPLRRRKEKRQLEHLAATTSRDGAPRVSAAHVKVIGDEPDGLERPGPQRQEPDVETPTDPPPRLSGFHVHAVPIDQPVGE